MNKIVKSEVKKWWKCIEKTANQFDVVTNSAMVESDGWFASSSEHFNWNMLDSIITNSMGKRSILIIAIA